MSQDFVVKLVQDIAKSNHTLKREPEPMTMEEENSVDDFNEVMKTNVTINYSAALDYIYRSRTEPQQSLSAIDLCSGPGHYTLCLNKYLGYEKITGIDLSRPMLEKALKNSEHAKGSIRFMHGDATSMDPSKFAKVDLVSCANSAHHLNSIDDVRSLLTFADKVCKPEGTIVLTDLCRLPNKDVTDRFISIIGDDYVKNGLLALAEDFRASMYAAWSPDEIAGACPYDTKRVWYQIVAGGLPFFQGIIGLPIGRSELLVRPSKDWASTGIMRTERALEDWKMTKDSFYAGMVRRIQPLAIAQKAAA